MDLSRPEWLWLLIPWSLMAIRTVWARRSRERDWKAMGQGGRPPRDGRFGSVLAALLLIVAAAQPRWGRDPAGTVPPGRDVVLLIDVSRSMGAEDAVPSRMGVAIESAQGLIAAMAGELGDRVGVVAFSGSGAVRCGLTENLGAAMDVVSRLRPGSVQPGGTDLGAALEVAGKAFDEWDHADGRMIVIFTDGEDHAGAWKERVEALREEGIIVNAVAIGDPDGGHPVPAGEGKGSLSYEGRPVASRRSDEALDAIAGRTGGVVIRLGLASADLGSLYRERIAPAARRIRHATHPPERAERFGVFVFAALMSLSIGARPKASRRLIRRWGVIGAAAMMFATGAGPASESPRRLIARGRAAFEAKRFEEALAAFKQAEVAAPRSAVPRFDAAATLFALGRYPEAIDRYEQARERGDASIRVKVDYAMGNAYLMAADPASAIREYDACIQASRRSKVDDAIRRDAEANREYALNRLRDQAAAPPEPDPGTDEEKPKGETTPEPKKSPAGSDNEEGQGGDGPRGKGGAGGEEPDTRPQGQGNSPQDRLDTALEHIREAVKNRLPDAAVITPTKGGKDW